jgi:hypothetical protein
MPVRQFDQNRFRERVAYERIAAGRTAQKKQRE